MSNARNLSSYAGQGIGFRNRIINGDMRIDQRNAGGTVASNSTTFPYTVDRWFVYGNSGGVFTLNRSTTAPAGYANSLYATVTTADSSIISTDQYWINQSIEGLNVVDLAWGTAAAQTVAVSFWVRSSITGTYPVSVVNNGSNRSYVTLYTVNAANTWEYKTVTIPGDTTGSWSTDNSTGVHLRFCLGAGSNFNGTANTWSGGYLLNTSACTQWIGTAGATFYITGVQLEKGSVATPFEVRPYGTELALCQRYYNISYASQGFIVPTNTGSYGYMKATGVFPVTMRAVPTVTNTAFGTAGTSTSHGGFGLLTTSGYSQEMRAPTGSNVWGEATNTANAEL